MELSFNAFGSAAKSFGGNIPIWLGTVSPRARGARLASVWEKAGLYLPAGTPLNVAEDADGMPIATPFVGFVVTAATTDTTNTIITVKPTVAGAKLTTSDLVQVIGASLADTGKAAAISAVAVNSDDPSQQDITVTTSAIDSVTVGKILAISAAASAGSSKSIANQPNAYLYNDVRIAESVTENIGATVAAVDFHGEGILIDRTPAAVIKDLMKVAVLHVIQING